ncbi:MAG: hypothetical protein ABI543_04850 [Ignavibacteria bacterium]
MKTRVLIFITTAALIMLSISQTGTSTPYNKLNKEYDSLISAILTLPNAEKILGEDAHLTESTITIKDDVTKHQLAYIADSLDKKSGKTGAVYFRLDDYKDIASAHKIYRKFFNENKDHDGIKVLKDVGDEAYFHSDGENFYYISIRKGNKLIIMKVNKITSKTSLDDFNSLLRSITGKL